MFGIHRDSSNTRARRAGSGLATRATQYRGRRRLTLEALEDRTLLSVFTVNSLGDTGAGTGTSGDLRFCITQANATTGDNTINFSVTGTITLNSALPDLSNTTGLTDIEGPGAASLTVARSSASGTPSFRVFRVDANANVKLVGLTITGGGFGARITNQGTLTVTNSTIENSLTGIGNQGTLTVTNSTIDNNSGSGGIENGGLMTVTNSTIAGNPNNGIVNQGNLTIANSTIDNNGNLFGAGGGISNLVGTLTITNSTIDHNLGSSGGISNQGTLTVTNSTIDHNPGVGILNIGTMTLTDSTIVANSATGFLAGGGIANAGSLTVTNSTIAYNSGTNGGLEVSGGTPILNNTIVALN